MKLRNKKTGEIINGCFVVCEYKDGARFSVKDKPVFDSLAEINEEWEDYKPLIKDEKIRRGLSEWIALYGEHEKIKYFRYNDFVVFRLCREKGTPEPEISLPIEYECDSLREGKEYTKPELCGDEEDGA